MARRLTSTQVAHLRRLGHGVRTAPTESEAESAIQRAVGAARVYHAGGAGYEEIARALEVTPADLRVWTDRTTPKARKVAARRNLAGSPAGSGILACSGDHRVGGNDFARELAAVRRHTEGAVTVVEQNMIEIVDLGRGLLRHRPSLLHIAAHSENGSILLCREDRAAPIPHCLLRDAILDAGHLPTIVVLNFCSSIEVVHELQHRIPSVVCWPGPATDGQLLELTELLYRSLGKGAPLTTGMDEVKLTLPRLGLTRTLLPRLVGDGRRTLR